MYRCQHRHISFIQPTDIAYPLHTLIADDFPASCMNLWHCSINWPVGWVMIQSSLWKSVKIIIKITHNITTLNAYWLTFTSIWGPRVARKSVLVSESWHMLRSTMVVILVIVCLSVRYIHGFHSLLYESESDSLFDMLSLSVNIII